MTTKEATQSLTTAQEVIDFAANQGLKIVDFKFVDLPGTWQHFSATIGELTPDVFSDGIGFDGSSIRGFQAIHESDMLLFPDPRTAIIDPVCTVPTLSLTCNVYDPLTREPYSRDPRHIALKAEGYLRETGIADVSYWGPEAEFFVFDNVHFEQTQNAAIILGRLERGHLEQRPQQRLGQPGPPPALEGRLLPSVPGRPIARLPLGSGAQAGRGGRAGRSASPRSGHGRPVRDRHALRQPGGHGRPHDGLQIRHQEHGHRPRQDGDLYAQAAVGR